MVKLLVWILLIRVLLILVLWVDLIFWEIFITNIQGILVWFSYLLHIFSSITTSGVCNLIINGIKLSDRRITSTWMCHAYPRSPHQLLTCQANKRGRWWLNRRGEWNVGSGGWLILRYLKNFLGDGVFMWVCELFAWIFYSKKQAWVCVLRPLTWKSNLILLVVAMMLCPRMRCFRESNNQLLWFSMWPSRNLGGDALF